jgi:hypothetical protein
MATPADQRLLELLEKWLKSLELHAKYTSLDDDSYWKIQPWVEHQRPSRWIIELAMQKTLALKAHVQERMEAGDTKYSDSLELMIFLANLVGSEHIERFIPLAEPENEHQVTQGPPVDATQPAADSATATREMPKFPAAKLPPDAAAHLPADSPTVTREMPNFLHTQRAPPPAGTAQVARTERKVAMTAKPAARPAPRPPAKPAKPGGRPAREGPPREGPSDVAREQVIADAARLVQWGRKWYELPELIARMADRPSLPDVRRILKENKSAIDAKAGGA